MSRTTLYAIGENGEIAESFDFRNSWGSASYVWREMARRYLGGEEAYRAMMFDEAAQRRVWDLWRRVDLPLHHRAVMLFTFDNVMVRGGDFGRLADDMDAFVADFPSGPAACSLPEQAATLRRLATESVYRAACWQQTSVSEDLWRGPWDANKEEEVRPYNIDIDDKHWWLYEALDAPAAQVTS